MKTEINGTKDLDGDVVAANLMDAAHNRNACKGAEPKIQEFAMHITSPFFVVPVIILVFACSIWFATSSKEDGPSSH